MLQEKFSDIITLIQQARQNAVQTVNTELINLYWLVGEHISKRLANSSWGEKTIDELAQYLNRQHPELKGFNRRGLYRMKQFYETYSSATIVSSVMTQLENGGIKHTMLTQVSWTHHLILLGRTRTDEEREFYLRLSIQEKYSVRELERQINSGVFERVMLGNQNQPPALKEINQDISNIFKDSYVFEFLNIPEPIVKVLYKKP
jgi:predicted nuclease of restriction endonuclease-like (RecB) superfamily